MRHELAPPTVQMEYPGGKDGLWEARCSCGDYTSGPYGSQRKAEAAVREHAAAKNRNALDAMTTDERVAEFLRQWAIPRTDEVIYNVWFDNDAQPTELRVADLTALVEEVRRLRRTVTEAKTLIDAVDTWRYADDENTDDAEDALIDAFDAWTSR